MAANASSNAAGENRQTSTYLPAPPPVSPLSAEFAFDPEADNNQNSSKKSLPGHHEGSNRPALNHSKSTSAVSGAAASTNRNIDNRPIVTPHKTTIGTMRSSSSSGASTSSSTNNSSTRSNNDVEFWQIKDVKSWLDEIRCSSYAQLFEEHDISGDVLLDCDCNTLKDMGIVKIGDRIRINNGITKLRSQVDYGAGRVRHSSAPAAVANTFSTTTSIGTITSASTLDSRVSLISSYPKSLEQLNEKVVSAFDHNTPSSSLMWSSSNQNINGGQGSNNSGGSRKKFTTPALSSRISVGPTQTVVMNNGHGEVNVLSMDIVKQNNVKFIFPEGESRTVNVSGCQTASDIKDRALKKLDAEANSNANSWGVFVTDSGVGITTRKLQDFELVAICRSTNRTERKRLIICAAGTKPTPKQLAKSQKIMRDSLELSSDYKSNNNRDSSGYLNNDSSTLTGARYNQMYNRSKSIYGDAAASGSGNKYNHHQQQEEDDEDDNGVGLLHGGTLKDAGALGLQRPPSELISSNLEEYFPDTNKQQLKETVRASRRFSKRVSRLSRYSNRMSIASLGIPESDERVNVPPVPPLPSSHSGKGSRQSVMSTTDSIRSNDIARHSSMISAIARRLSTMSISKSQKHASVNSQKVEKAARETEADALNEGRHEGDQEGESDEDEEEEEEEDLDESEEIDELIDVIRREETGPTRWIKGNFIGSGSFGQVYLGMNAVTGELMAVKQVELPSTSDTGDESRKTVMIDALNHEMSLLRVLQHPNIVQYFGSNTDEKYLNIFLEYVPGGSVATMLANYGPFETSLVRSFVRQILDGLDYLHKQKIVHRDIKGANILVDNRGNIKISDFGISKKIEAEFMPTNRASMQGSVFWMAPEVVKQTSYTSKADIWSLGCLIVEMFTGNHPFPEFSQMQAIFRLGNSGSPSIPEDCPADAKAFLKETFQIDFNKRPTASELLAHEFVKGARKKSKK